MAESLLTGLVFTFFIVLVGRNFASGICKVNLETYFLNLVFFCIPGKQRMVAPSSESAMMHGQA